MTEWACYLVCLEFEFHLIIIHTVNNIFRVIILITREIIKLIKKVGQIFLWFLCKACLGGIVYIVKNMIFLVAED